MTLDFEKRLLPVSRSRSVFKMDGWYVWCGTIAKTDDGLFHLLFSRWPESEGFDAWVTHSEIAHAVSDSPLGPFAFTGVVLPGAGTGWDAGVTHNPTVIRAEGRYYLYYMGTKGPGDWWDYRNNQRIGVAVADHPAGPWKRFDQPVIDVTQGEWDCLMTSNPSCTKGPDGKFYLMYKGVGAGPMPKGGKVLAGIAVADNPLGPFIKKKGPVIENPENGWSVEDAFIWCQNGMFYGLIKDFQGYFTGAGENTIALFESKNGLEWQPAANPLALKRVIEWDDREKQKMFKLERPQLWIDGGRPSVLLCACRPDECSGTFNVLIPLK